MTPEQQQAFIEKMYQDLFTDALVDKIPDYCSADFVEENNYDVLDYEAFVAHIEDLAQRDHKARFEFDYLVNVPGQVVIRTLVYLDKQIAGAPPSSLLISYWQFNEQGKVNYCKEVEHS